MAKTLRKQIAQNHRNTIFIMLVFIALMAVIGGIFAWLNAEPKILIWFLIEVLQKDYSQIHIKEVLDQAI